LELHAPCDGVLVEVAGGGGGSVRPGSVLFRISGRPIAANK
jgi:biotin carboxyl carrier protein